ncbi:MAG TPA: helix-turn-helix transcriptional regulator [Pseudonocardiaceae bacterium]|nr:helix-turn-helix transcriptional regulator [Pseudonocardiaceae bacterium]
MADQGPIDVPLRDWRREDVRQALRDRDMSALLRTVQRYTGVSQTRLASATGLVQGRVSEILRGQRTVTSLDVFERLADGLGMPDEARVILGLAPVHPAGLDHLGPSGRAEIISIYPSQSTAVPDINAAARDAHRIDVLAVRGLGIVGLNDSLLRSTVIDRQPHLRVLLLDPDSEAAHRRAREIRESRETFASGIQLAIARLRELAEHGAEVELALYDQLPTWRLLGLDSTLFVSAFGSSHEGHISPMYRITRTASGALHRGFVRFRDELWRNARQVI